MQDKVEQRQQQQQQQPVLDINTQPDGEFAIEVEGLEPGTKEYILCKYVNALSTFNLGPHITEKINLSEIAVCFPEMGGARLMKRFEALFVYLSTDILCQRREMIYNMSNTSSSSSSSSSGCSGGDCTHSHTTTTATTNSKKIVSDISSVLILLFTTGKAVVTGARNQNESVKMAQHFCNMFRERTGKPAIMTDFRARNFVARCRLPHTIALEELVKSSRLGAQLKYNPQEFRMVIMRPESFLNSSLNQTNKKLTALISRKGSINMTGLRCTEELFNFMTNIYRHLKYFQPGAGPPPWLRPNPVSSMLRLAYTPDPKTTNPLVVLGSRASNPESSVLGADGRLLPAATLAIEGGSSTASKGQTLADEVAECNAIFDRLQRKEAAPLAKSTVSDLQSDQEIGTDGVTVENIDDAGLNSMLSGLDGLGYADLEKIEDDENEMDKLATNMDLSDFIQDENIT